MKLACPEWTQVLQWDACHPASLVLEAPEDYLKVLSDLSAQAGGLEGELVISSDAGELSVEKDVLLVRDLWSVDLNQKKLMNGICRRLVQISQDDYGEEVCKTMHGISALLGRIIGDSGLPLTWEEPPDILPILKALNVMIEASDDVMERLLDTVRFSQEFLKTRLLIVTGLRSFLRYQELTAFCRDYIALGMPILLIDSQGGSMVEGERRLTLDADHCELLLP